jgi:amino acid adenylation domain-containing protein
MSGAAPASWGQEQLWLAEQAAPGLPANNDARIWRLRGPVDPVALRSAVELVVARHAALRTVLRVEASGLRQHVIADPAAPVSLVAIPSESDAIADFVHLPFDLAAERPIRVGLARLGPEHHLLVLVIHHTACDGRSFVLLREDLVAAYEAQVARTTLTAIDPDEGYLTFAAEERAGWTADAASTQPWLDRLRDAGRNHQPLAAAPRRQLVGRAASYEVDLPAAGVQRLISCAADHGITPTMAFSAIFAAVLSRWTDQRQVLFSTPIGTRRDPRFHRTVGFFVNSVPLLIDVSEIASTADLFGRARSAMLTALEHAHVPQGEVRAALADGRPDIDPLHDITFMVEHAESRRFTMAGVAVIVERPAPKFTMFGVSVIVSIGDDDEHRLTAIYDRSIHAAAAVERRRAVRLMEHFREAISAAGTQRPLPALPERELASVLAWGRGEQTDPGPGLLERIAEHVERQPDAQAVRDRDGVLTYAGLWRAAGRLSRRLRRLDLGAEDLVAICQPRSINLVISVLGVLRSGAAFMPLDPRDPCRRWHDLLRGARARALVVAPRMGSESPAIPDGGWTAPVDSAGATWNGLVLTLGGPDDEGNHDRLAADAVRPDQHGLDTLAYVINTSGTTGVPKGVMINHRSLANYLSWAAAAYGLGPGTTTPLHTSVAFDLAITSLLGPLFAGGCVEVLPEGRGPLSVAEGMRGDYQLVKGTPSHLLAVLEEGAARSPGEWPAVLAFGGENLPVDQVRRWQRAAPQTVPVNEYGPTETTVASTAYEVRWPMSGSIVPIGRPLANTTAYIVDQNLSPVPIGVRGELLVGGVGVARGYMHAPGRTAERFIPDPFGPPGGRLYRTGDLALWNADAELELVGRVDDQVKVLGYRVEPGEVEAALAQLPGVRRAAVLADDGDPQLVRLVAFVCPDRSTDTGTLPEQARASLSMRLPGYMVPDEFVVLDRLPLNTNGKIDRSALKAALTRPAPPASAAQVTIDGSGRCKERVRAAWCEVLTRDNIPDDLNFFEAGGTSLMLLRLYSALRTRGVTGFSVADLFRSPTIDSFTARLAVSDQ